MRGIHGLLAATSAVATIGLCSSVANAGQLVNESFEVSTLGTTYGWGESTIPGWQFQPGPSGYGGARVDNTAGVGQHGSNFAVEQFGTLQTAAPDRIAVTPGDNLSLSVLFRNPGTTWSDSLLYIDFYTNNTSWDYTPVSSSDAYHLPNSNWGGSYSNMAAFMQFSTGATVPAGVTYVGVRLQSPDIWQGEVQLDNVLLTGATSVPEPATLGLVGGAMLLLGRRSRSRR